MTEKRRTPSGSENAKQTSSVLSGLPRSRPHRRSEKRASNGGATAAAETPEVGAAAPEAAKAGTASKAGKAAAKARASAPNKGGAAGRKTSPAAAAKTSEVAGPAAAGPKTGGAASATGARRAPTTAKSRRGQMRQPPQPRGLPETERRSAREAAGDRRQSSGRRDLVATAVQAAAELTEIGLSAGARVLRDAVSRLPRP